MVSVAFHLYQSSHLGVFVSKQQKPTLECLDRKAIYLKDVGELMQFSRALKNQVNKKLRS